MVTRILPAVAEPDAARSMTALLGQLPDAEPAPPVGDSTTLVDALGRLAQESINDLPEVVLVHERIGPVPALELIRDIAMRFPGVGLVLVTVDASQALISAAMDSGARGLVSLPLSYDQLSARVQAAASWAVAVRAHLSDNPQFDAGPGGTVVTVTGAKGGTGATLTSVQLALAACASGQSVALVDMDLQAGDVASYLDVRFRRSIVDLASISDISPRVLQDAVFAHETGLGLLLAPGEGEQGEMVSDRAVRQIVSALRTRYQVVIVDTGTHMSEANAAAIEMADTAVLLTTLDAVSVRAAKRMVKLWQRLQIRKGEETLAVANRYTRSSEIQPSLIGQIVGCHIAKTAIPSAFKELQGAVDAGRMQDLEPKGAVKQALWGLAGELGLMTGKPLPDQGGKLWSDRGAITLRRSRRGGIGRR
ncbi:AAA family ATPase [Streptomyces gobiensis]|uniref:AAA family ATPase n=1 Tax=Streptomyces gobiensis TaxID=2875706 RepID=UPI001E2E7917|nr:AAA family ATPase [Streptomyces gobiensis]UGY93361.1 AAA family ATPase [Streptomyces gobiensis]